MKLLNTCLSLLATCISLQASAVSTVLLYDSPTNPNAVDITNAAPAPYPLFVASFALGFLGNTGGVINFDPLQSITPYPALGTSFIDARYGIGMVNNMHVSFGNPVDMAPSGGFQIPISGVGALHQPIAAPLAFKLTPSNGLPIKPDGFSSSENGFSGPSSPIFSRFDASSQTDSSVKLMRFNSEEASCIPSCIFRCKSLSCPSNKRV